MSEPAPNASARCEPAIADPNAAAPPGLRQFLTAVDGLGRLSGYIASLALAALTLLILGEICVRLLSTYIPGLPAGIPTAWEVSSYLMGIAFMCGAAMTLRAGGHIRVSVLMAQLSAGGKRALEVVSSIVGLALTGFLTYSLVFFTWASYERGQTSPASDIQLWIPEAAITFGAGVLALQMLARLIQALLSIPVEDARLRIAAPGE